MSDHQTLQKAYRDLGMDGGETFDAIKRRHKRLIMVWHPDRFQNPEGKAEAEAELKKPKISCPRTSTEHIQTLLNAPADSVVAVTLANHLRAIQRQSQIRDQDPDREEGVPLKNTTPKKNKPDKEVASGHRGQQLKPQNKMPRPELRRLRQQLKEKPMKRQSISERSCKKNLFAGKFLSVLELFGCF